MVQANRRGGKRRKRKKKLRTKKEERIRNKPECGYPVSRQKLLYSIFMIIDKSVLMPCQVHSTSEETLQTPKKITSSQKDVTVENS